MKVNELQKQIRIGNYLLGKCEDELDERKVYWKIYQIKDAEDLMSVKMDWDKPIELTEEWLLKFGFEKKAEHNFRLKVFARSIIHGYTHGKVEIELGNMSGYSFGYPQVHYVHQLQNLYFALCGEELELKN